MFLSDKDIKKAIEEGEIIISDFTEDRLQPASYDILLGNKFIINDSHNSTFIDPVNKIYPEGREIEVAEDGSFVLHPGISILGYSRDFFGSDHYMVEVNGKSSLARIGLLVHNSASLVNPGHFLNIALELCNLNNVPIILRPGMPIGQLTFTKLTSPVNTNYKKSGRYAKNNLKGFVPPKEEKNKITKKTVKKGQFLKKSQRTVLRNKK